MPPKMSGPPPSRRGKRQLVVFLEPSFAHRIRLRAEKEQKTVQEMLGAGMNEVLVANGYRAIFPVGHQRLLKRNRAVAAPRKTTTTTLARRGLASISGWFDLKFVNYVNSAANELGFTLQQLAEVGLKAMMKKPPAAATPPAAAAEEEDTGQSRQKSKPRKRKRDGDRDAGRDRRGEVRDRPV